MNDFFVEISKPLKEEDSGSSIEKLFKLSQAINMMTPNELISFFQALSMLKKMQPWHIFKKNLVRERIIDTQLLVINAMQNYKGHAARFNNVIGDEWIRGYQYHIN